MFSERTFSSYEAFHRRKNSFPKPFSHSTLNWSEKREPFSVFYPIFRSWKSENWEFSSQRKVSEKKSN
jgi:hypothetical protein